MGNRKQLRLALGRETLRTLGGRQLEEVAGGIMYTTVPVAPQPTALYRGTRILRSEARAHNTLDCVLSGRACALP